MTISFRVMAAVISVMFGQVARPGEKSEYRVCEVLAVRSVWRFECTLKGCPYADSVRFNVQIRDVVVNPQIPSEEATEYLYERLKNADSVVLEKIQFRNYFRLIADVRVDGRNLAEELIQQRLALSVEPAKERPPAELTQKENQMSVEEPALRYSPAEAPPAKMQTVTLQSLLDTQVDLSSITSETSVEEALQILSDSVRPRLPFVILWNDLAANALIEKETPIGIGGFGRMKLGKGLEIILHSLSPSVQTKLVLAFEGQVMTVGTRSGLLQKSMARCYSVEDITLAPFEDNSDNRTGNNGNFTRNLSH